MNFVRTLIVLVLSLTLTTSATAGGSVADRLASADRSEADKARDAGRKPAEVLAFLGVEEGMTVIDVIAAGGWYSEAIAAAVEGSDLVINLVGILYEKGSQRFAAVHAQGAERIAQAARTAGVARLIHVSAIGADPASPAAYARSKAAVDLLAASYAARGLDVVRVRPFNHTGPGQTDAFVASSFARQLAEMELGTRPPVLDVGNLDAERDFLDVEDVIAYPVLSLGVRLAIRR